MVEKNTTFLLLSGQTYRDYIDFWIGFINIQRALKTSDHIEIFAHLWNPNDLHLIKHVYGNIEIIINDFLETSKILNSFEMAKKKIALDINSNIPSLYYMYQSRKYVLKHLSKKKILNNDRIILTRYDIGYRLVTPEVSTVIIDDSLPKDYIYMPFYNEIDEGYGDQWFVFGFNYLPFFHDLDDNINDYLTHDDYFKAYTESWPNSNRRSKFETSLFYFKKILIYKILKIIDNIKVDNNYLNRKLKGISIKLNDNKDLIGNTGEIESLSGTTFSKYPKSNALNSHALLKYAIYKNGLRDRVRFLHYNDFQSHIEGVVIAPSKIAVLIYSHSSYSDCWEMTINQFRENLLGLDYKIYIATENSANSDKYLKEVEGKVSSLFYDEKEAYTQRLKSVLTQLSSNYNVVYFVHEDMPLYAKVDSIFLNSLIKYFTLSEEFYIKLVDTSFVKKKIKHPDFPGLVKNNGYYSLSIQPSIIKIEEFRELLSNLSLSIYEFENHMHSDNRTFSAVAGNKKVGKFLYINGYFPHVATALFKGKWTTSDWSETLNPLLEKYKLNPLDRGMF